MLAPSNPNAGKVPTRTASSSPAGPALVGVFVTLADQHRQVLELLREAGVADGAVKRQARWSEAKRRLLAHERAETQVIYRQLEQQTAARTMLGQHAAQAAELESAVQDLEAVDIEADIWIERLRDVLAMVDDHVRDEENDFFPLAQRLLGNEAAIELQTSYESAQRDALHAL
jgi:hypothetical protein